MRRTSAMAAAMAVLLATAGRMAAQPPSPKPGPEHEHFKQFEGVWDAKVQMGPMESKGTMTWKVGLGGLWLLEHFEGEFGTDKFEGRGASSFDPMKKKYVGVWIDSMSTSPMTFEGTYDKSTKTMKSVGISDGPDGKPMKMMMTTHIIDADNITFVMSGPAGPDGKEGEMFKITYKRRAK